MLTHQTFPSKVNVNEIRKRERDRFKEEEEDKKTMNKTNNRSGYAIFNNDHMRLDLLEHTT